MQITISGEAREIASLVLVLQGKPREIEPLGVLTLTGKPEPPEERQKIANALRTTLAEQSQDNHSQRQPYPTSQE